LADGVTTTIAGATTTLADGATTTVAGATTTTAAGTTVPGATTTTTTVPDTTAPTAGTAISFSGVSGSGMTVVGEQEAIMLQQQPIFNIS